MRQIVYLGVVAALVLNGCASQAPPALPSLAAEVDEATSTPDQSAQVLPEATQAPEDCPVTSAFDERPPEEALSSWSPLGRWYRSPDSQVWVAENNLRDLNTLGLGQPTKVLWGKPAGIDLVVAGRRLDGEAPPLIADISPYYHDDILNPSGIGAPTPGCWEIEARAGDSVLRIVVEVPSTTPIIRSSPETEDAAPPAELFRVRPEGAKGSLIAYDMSDGREAFTLPAGMLSAYGRDYYAATAQADTTRLDVFDPDTGNLERSFTLDGQWALSGVSPLGRWLALTRIADRHEKQSWIAANQWWTDIQIVDGNSGAIAHILSLDGNFEVETISAGGDSLFLVQHLPAVNPDHYLIRLYDLSAESLQADPLRAKGADEVMAGLAWDGLASPDGRWLLTLYLSTQRNVAFIHTLDLRDKFPVCIDLPPREAGFDQLKHYTLALAPDGQTVYATNAALGIVAEVSLYTRRLTRMTDVDRRSSPTEYDAQTPVAHSIVSSDGQTVYFTDSADVWAYDTGSRKVSGPYAIGARILGLGLSADGQRLYVAREGRLPLALDVADGGALSSLPANEASRAFND
jgi:hypothetical protein